ncbi:50S ribosomal protein L5 [Patescibacteria group bacterium]|nr:50S ribosomal protein L5 [Patescibacteria group bacterium]
MNNLKDKYNKNLVEELKTELKVENAMAVPALMKIVINIGMGEAVKNPQALEKMADDLALISGQKPKITKTDKAISNFGIREGMAVGMMVTLRRARMWDFFEKLVSIVLPRLKDFRGVSRKAFDGFGNYSLGIVDHTVFPEIDPNQVDRIRSLQVIIVTSARTDNEGLALLQKLGMPFAKEQEMKALERMEASLKEEKKEALKMKEMRKAEGKQDAEDEKI